MQRQPRKNRRAGRGKLPLSPSDIGVTERDTGVNASYLWVHERTDLTLEMVYAKCTQVRVLIE